MPSPESLATRRLYLLQTSVAYSKGVLRRPQPCNTTAASEALGYVTALGAGAEAGLTGLSGSQRRTLESPSSPTNSLRPRPGATQLDWQVPATSSVVLAGGGGGQDSGASANGVPPHVNSCGTEYLFQRRWRRRRGSTSLH